MEIVAFGGWNRCARLADEHLELIVTLEVGPRILSFSRPGGPNVLAVYERHAGLTGGEEFRSYGGHRLWVAPEIPGWTTEPDNRPVETREEDGYVWFATPPGPAGLRKEIGLRLGERSVELMHRVSNVASRTQRLAPWALTVMAPGGQCLFPLPEYRPHEEALLPAGPLVLWHYTDLSDPRWTWGRRLVRLRQTGDLRPQKIGAAVPAGWAAYASPAGLFVKRFGFEPDETYPDFGCNFETFTREDMLELESLGPLVDLAPGDSVSHAERWFLSPPIDIPEDDDEALALLRSVLP